MGIHFRPFRNTDPPALVQLWNGSFIGRGAVFLQGTLPLEQYVLSKSYFDRNGLIVAVDEGQPVGFVHAGFGPTADGSSLAFEKGVICTVAVRATHRRRGIGTALLHQAENYLRAKGAREIYAGTSRPLNPFYWGLYGGSDPPGVLLTDAAGEPFLLKNGYVPGERHLVLQKNLDTPPKAVDGRFAMIRRNFELHIGPRPVSTTWYEECGLAPFEVLQFELRDSRTRIPVAWAKVWDMDLFVWRWHQPTAGIVALEVVEPLRRQGIAKYLLVQVLRYLQDQFFTLTEAHAAESNEPARRLFEELGYQQVDEGRTYRLQQG